MTITDTTVPPVVRDLTDEQLLDLYRTDEAAALAIAARQDKALRMAAARRALSTIRAEGESAAFAQYLEADGACAGVLLSKAGKAAHQRGEISDETALWRIPWERVQVLASEELLDWFTFTAPRITSADYVRQQAAERRRARTEAREGNRDEHDAGTGLAGHEAGALRREGTAEGVAESAGGGDRAVQRGGHSAAEGEAGQDGTADGRASGPVQRLEAGGSDMDVIRAGIGAYAQHDREQARQAADAPAEPRHDPMAAVIAGEMRGPGRLVPGEDPDAAAPGDMRHVLDETAAFIGRYVSCTPAQADVMTLYATATSALQASPAFGEMLFTANAEQAGKTTAMAVTAALCANPVSAKGTVSALQSELAAAANEPEKPQPVLFYDEIGGLYGASGLNRGGNWVLDDVLRDGYKNGATRKWSVNRSSQEFSIHIPVLMTGRGTSLPRDIRSRTIVVRMEPATPRAYFDLREGQPEARALSACLAQAVAAGIKDIAAFRARGIHPKLTGRKLEVWELLFAVAYVLGGQEWLNRCLAAFRELAIAESEQVTLTPRQQVLRDAVTVIEGPLADAAESGFIGGLALADEMRRLDNPLYAARSEAGMAKLISEAMPVATTQKRVDGKPVRGYFAFQVTEAWEAVRPAGMEDASIAEEENPFAVTGDAEDVEDVEDGPALTCDVAGEAGVTGTC